MTFQRFRRGYVAYEVLADLILAGWRPSADPDQSSPLENLKRLMSMSSISSPTGSWQSGSEEKEKRCLTYVWTWRWLPA